MQSDAYCSFVSDSRIRSFALKSKVCVTVNSPMWTSVLYPIRFVLNETATRNAKKNGMHLDVSKIAAADARSDDDFPGGLSSLLPACDEVQQRRLGDAREDEVI